MADYDFDITGEDIAFRVVEELNEVGGIASNEYNILIPKFAPFFWESFELEKFNSSTQTWETLEKGVDYTPAYQFVQAQRQLTKHVFGGIVFRNRSLQGVVRYNYQKLGGSWTIFETSPDKYLEILANKIINPRMTTWEQVTGYPNQFPVVDHVHSDYEDMTTMNDVNVSINRLADAVEALVAAETSGGLSPEDRQSIIDDARDGLALDMSGRIVIAPFMESGHWIVELNSDLSNYFYAEIESPAEVRVRITNPSGSCKNVLLELETTYSEDVAGNLNLYYNGDQYAVVIPDDLTDISYSNNHSNTYHFAITPNVVYATPAKWKQVVV